MEKNIIVFLNIRDKFEFNSESIESIRCAANRWNADVFEITTSKYGNSLINNHLQMIFWNKLWVMENFSSYDKVLWLDTDTIVNSKAPNIFNLLDKDIAGVKDGNPGRLKDDFFKNNQVKNIAFSPNVTDYFDSVPSFDVKKYWDDYINVGVLLFDAKIISKKVKLLKDLIFNNPKIWSYLYSPHLFTEQNLFNLWFSSFDVDLQILDNKWNWIAPDMNGWGGELVDQFDPDTGEHVMWEHTGIKPNYTHDFFSNTMYPHIYHFCGTNGAKKVLKSYKSWR